VEDMQYRASMLLLSSITVAISVALAAQAAPPPAAPQSPSEPADDCSLSLDAIDGVLDPKRLDAYTGARKDRRFVESALVGPSKRKVTFSLGGCAHYGYVVTFALDERDSVDDFGPDGAPRKMLPMFGLARRLLDEVPVRAGRESPLAQFKDAMRDRLARAGELSMSIGPHGIAKATSSVSTPFDCGEYNNCEISVDASSLSLSFDFPL